MTCIEMVKIYMRKAGVAGSLKLESLGFLCFKATTAIAATIIAITATAIRAARAMGMTAVLAVSLVVPA